MTLDQLRAFDAVVRYGTIRAASNHIFKSAPSISLAIKSLEENIGVKLFSRSAYRLVLTEDGEQLYLKTQEILLNIHEFNTFAKNRMPTYPKKFNVSLCPYTPHKIKTTLAMILKRDFPKTELIFHPYLNNNVKELIDETNMDLVFTSRLNGVDVELHCHYTLSIPLIAVASSQLIADTKCHISVQGVFDEAANSSNRINVDSTETLKSLLNDGLGWGVIPNEFIEDELSSGKLVNINPKTSYQRKIEYFAISKKDKKIECITDSLLGEISS